MLVFARTSVTQLTEQWMYDTISFLGEAGGALGLFLGFSFLMLWDILSSVVNFALKWGNLHLLN